jgi:hypothetical protein
MSDEPMTAGQLMMVARPFAVDEFDDAWDDAVGRRTLGAIVAGQTPSPKDAGDLRATAARGSSGPSRSGVWSYGVSVAAVAAAIATIVAIVLTGHASHAPAANQPTGTARPVVPPAVVVSSAPSTVTRSEADAVARACVIEVRATLRSMITAYRQPNGGKAPALAQLRAAHAPSSSEYGRDAAAFGDWIARGGTRGKVTVAAVAGHACVQ